MKLTLSFLLLFFFIRLNLWAFSANEIAQKSYNVNHSFSVKNMIIKKRKRKSILSISRSVNFKPRITAFERYLSNDFNHNVIEAKDLIIIRSGKLKGLGILMTSYTDPHRSHEYLMWLPALRKVRRMAEPKDAGMGAGDIAFLEDAKLRRYYEESYTLLETKKISLDLKMMPFMKEELGRYTKYIPYAKHTQIPLQTYYILKSTYKEKGHWYDYRISYIDTQHFRDYLTYYYKNGKKIKVVYRHWLTLKNQAKTNIWYYWYSKDTVSNYEMMTYIPPTLIRINQKVKKSFWTTQTLEKIRK